MYLQVLCELEDMEFRVMASTCDQGGANYGFKTTLRLTKDAPWIQNPEDQTLLFSTSMTGSMYTRICATISFIDTRHVQDIFTKYLDTDTFKILSEESI